MITDARAITSLVGLCISAVAIIADQRVQIKKFTLPLNYITVPCAVVVILACSTCIPGVVLINGLLGSASPDWAKYSADTDLIPLSVLALILFLAYSCLSADNSGLLARIATSMASKAKKAKQPQYVGLVLFFVFASVFTLVTSNDIVILTLTPVILGFSKILGGLRPMLLCEFTAANAMSVCFLTGNPSNVILTSVFNIDFLQYLAAMGLPGFIAGLLTLVVPLLWLLAGDSVKANTEEGEQEEEERGPLDANEITSLVFLVLMFILFLCSSFIQDYIPNFQLCYIAGLIFLLFLVKDVVLQARKKVSICAILKRMPWTLPLFLLSMFILVEETVYIGLVDDVADAFASYIVEPAITNLGNAAPFALGLFFNVFTCVVCCVFNNLPATIFVSKITSSPGVSEMLSSHGMLQMVSYSVAAGANYGACLMRHCSLAGLMWEGLIKPKEGNILGRVWLLSFATTPLLVLASVGVLMGEHGVWIS